MVECYECKECEGESVFSDDVAFRFKVSNVKFRCGYCGSYDVRYTGRYSGEGEL